MNLDRVADLLASGLKPAQVATIIGVTPARISQLLSEEDFKLILASKVAIIEAKDIEEISLSAKYSAAEHALVNQVMELAPTAELRDVTSALRVVAERQERMKSRLTPATAGNMINNTIIALSLPSHALALPVMDITKQGEIISIGDRALAPLSSTAVINLFSKMSSTEEEKKEIEESKKGEYHEQSPNFDTPEVSSSAPVSKKDSFLSYAAG